MKRTGCGLLPDVNNVFVASTNHNTDPGGYLARVPVRHVREVHLGGHSVAEDDLGAPLPIDSHDTPVRDPVWALYADAVARIGPAATLIERDNDVPDWSSRYSSTPVPGRPTAPGPPACCSSAHADPAACPWTT